MILTMDLGINSYDIIVERHCLKKANQILDLNRKVLIVTDDGVPSIYSKLIASQCLKPYIVTLKQGEATKNLENYAYLLEKLLEYGFNRKDCVVACGGGVCGDLAGFVSSTYMRGIDFYNCPTTVLSQVDSSIGGKTAIDFKGVKNVVGSFYQPKKVLIDPEVLKTLPKRQIANGLAEAVKMASFGDVDLFELFEEGKIMENIDIIIYKSLMIKKKVVEEDEKEKGLRKILNFGHTIGHGIEASYPSLYHGECVALGTLGMCSAEVRTRLSKIYQMLEIPTDIHFDSKQVLEALKHDKKSISNGCEIIVVDKIGSFEIKKESYEELAKRLDNCVLVRSAYEK